MAQKLAKASVDREVDAMLESLDFDDWDGFADSIRPDLEREGMRSADFTLAALVAAGYGAKIGTPEYGKMVEGIHAKVAERAGKRSAEMVGTSRQPDGTLIPNPKARWRITESTRDMIRANVKQAVTGGLSRDQLASLLDGNTAFSEARAQMIAQTELTTANSEASYDAWNEAGVSEKKIWLLSNDPNVCEICIRNAAAGPIPMRDRFPSGHRTTGAHPRCHCDVAALVSAA